MASETEIAAVLMLFKMSLGVTHTHRDEYFIKLINARISDLAEKGVVLDLSLTEDQVLLSDYTDWTYRKRTEDVPIAQNLQWRIRNRTMKARATSVG